MKPKLIPTDFLKGHLSAATALFSKESTFDPNNNAEQTPKQYGAVVKLQPNQVESLIYVRIFLDARYIAGYAFANRAQAERHIEQSKRDFARLPFTYQITTDAPNEPIVWLAPWPVSRRQL